MPLPALVIGKMIFTQVKAAILAEITAEKKPDYVGLINKLDEKLGHIIVQMDESIRQQYQFDLEKYLLEFQKLSNRIISQAKKVCIDEEEWREEHIKRFKKMVRDIEASSDGSLLTELKFVLFGGDPSHHGIPGQPSLPQKYKDYLVLHKNPDKSGISLLEFCGLMMLFKRGALETIIALKILYVRACQIIGDTPRKASLEEIDEVARTLIDRVIDGRAMTFTLYYTLFKIKETMKCNIQQVQSGKALDGVDGRTTMLQDRAQITMTNWIPPIQGLGDIKFDPPVYIIHPPDPNNLHMRWHLSATDDMHLFIKHKEGIKLLGWYEYSFMTRRSAPTTVSTGEPMSYGTGNILSIEDPNVLGQRNILHMAKWDIWLTATDESFLFKNVGNNAVLDGNADIPADNVLKDKLQLYVNEPTSITVNYRHWRILDI